MTVLYSHPDCLEHQTPDGHPERVARLQAVLPILADLGLDTIQAPLAEDADILRCHPQSHLDRIKSAQPGALDADTWMSAGSLAAAQRAVGGNVAAVDLVMAGGAANAFCAMRPPGHHAEHETPKGFCLFGNVSIAAKRLLDHHGLTRVAIVDFDVHHGNGTQDLLWDEDRVLFASTHQMPLYPGSGAPHETGAHNNILNRALPSGAGSKAFRDLYEREILPAVSDYAPEFLLISAGFDAHARDPLASLEVQTDDFGWVTRRLCEIAETACDGRIVSTLEGGYDLEALAESTAAHVGVLKEKAS